MTIDLSQRFAGLSEVKRNLLSQIFRREGVDASLLPIQPRIPTGEAPPLSYAQQSLWFMCHLAANSAVYNLPSAVRLRGRLERSALERAFNEIIRRHEILRTRFPATGGKPRQEILPHLSLHLPVVRCSNLPEAERETRALELAHAASREPFDLGEGPLMRVVLYELSEDDHIVLLVFHHLIWDGWSIGVMTQELALLYTAFVQGNASPLPDLPLHYADYTLWQREWLSGEVLDAQVSYWEEHLRGVEDLRLPTDRPRPPLPTFAGGMEFVEIPEAQTVALEELSQKAGTTMYMTLQAAFQLLLSRYSGQERIAVGTPIANRRRREVEGLIGYFANILVIAGDLSGDPTFFELLARIRDVTTGAYAHQDIPFELLVDRLHIARDPSRNPLFQVMFALHQESFSTLSLPGLELTAVNLGSETTHFDLGLHLWRRSQGLQGYVSYNKDLFDRLTILRLVSHFTTLLGAAVRTPDRPISTLPLLTEVERTWLLERNSVVPMGGAPRCVHERIAERIAEMPAAAALVQRGSNPGEERRFTFRALGERADQVAHHLSLQVRASSVVGLLLPPGPEFAAAMLGAWRAGVVILPLDVRSSPDRLATLVADAGVTALLTNAERLGTLPNLSCKLLCMESLTVEGLEGAGTCTPRPATPEAIAYLSYASGHRLAVTHQALARRIARLGARFELAPGEAVIGTTGWSHDSLAVELLWPLTRGATTVLPADSTVWPEGPQAAAVRYVHFTPAALSVFLQSCSDEMALRFGGLRGVLCGGGLLRSDVVTAFHRRLGSQLFYLLAPPEVATEVAIHPCRPGVHEALTSGKPDLLPVYVFERGGQLAPVNAAGRIRVAHEAPPPGTLPALDVTIETCLFGRWSQEGMLEVLGTAPRTLWWNGARFELPELESTLMRHPSIDACHAVTHVTGGIEELVIYVVPSHVRPWKQLTEHLRLLLPEKGPRTTFVPVNTLPLTPAGQVDEKALSGLEVIDEELMERWEQRLASWPGVGRVKVLAAEQSEPRKHLHVADLLPSLRTNKAVERHTTSTSASTRTSWDGASVRLAFSDGGPLRIPEDAPRTLTEALLRGAAAGANRGLTLYQDEGRPRFVSYAELLETARRILSGLRAAGLGRGDRVILQLENLRDHFATFWACVLGGIAPVTVTTPSSYDRKNGVLNKLYNVWELLRRPSILTNEHLVGPLSGALKLYEDVPGSHGFRLLAVEQLERHSPTSDIHPAEPTDVVFLQLTSGSTGVPKCIQETHRGIIHHIHGSQQFNGYRPDDVTLNWLPMDHVVPILTCHLKDTYLGIQQLHVRTPLVLAEPLKWLDLIQAHRVTHTWSPNFGFKLVNDALTKNPRRSWDLSSLRFMMNAGEQVTVPVIDEFLRRTAAFGVRQQVMQPAFGMAEVCTCMTYANDYAFNTGARRVLKSSLGGVLQEAGPEEQEAITFVDLGPPMPGVQIRIADNDNRVLPESVIGLLQIRGAVTTPGYLYNDEANREAFVGEGWFNSGDLGFIKDGRLTLTGRQKEMIIVRGANFYCYEIEDAVNAVTGVEPTFVAACAVDDPSTGTEGLAIFFVPQQPGINLELLRAIRERITADFGLAPSFIVPITRESFPKTTSGKIQRTHLKKELARGAFDDLLKRIDLLAENENTLPEWFYRRVWQRKELLVPVGGRGPGVSLVFMDDLGLGRELRARLGEAAIQVEPANAFAKLGPRHYTIDPRQPAQYSELLASLDAEGIVVEQAFHLWTYGPPAALTGPEDIDAAQVTGSASLLLLAKALAHAGGSSRAARLLVVSSHTQARGADERIAFERVPLLGLVRTIPQEWPHLDCRHIDLPPEEHSTNVERLLREAAAPVRDREVIYRDGGRWRPRLEKATVTQREDLPLRPGELVLMSGGLGGIGLELAKWMLEQHGVCLLLIGRTPLDMEEESVALDAVATRGTAAERAEAFRKLSQLGEVRYETADIGDFERVRDIVARAEEHWGKKLSGVIHLAGVFPARLLDEETPEGLVETLRPKLAGAWTLERVLGPEGFFVGFGSVYGTFGGAASGAYAAANAALEAFIDERRRRGLERSFHFAWSNWANVGMSRGYLLEEQSRAQGYAMISPRRGICSLLAGLASGHRSLLVGVDARKPNLRRQMLAPPAPLQRLVAYVAPSRQGASSGELRAVELADRFGHPSRCELHELSELPLSTSGEIDVARLLGMTTHQEASRERVLPRTGLERTIAAVWREVLGLEEIDIHTSFFSLGGQSILLIQVLSRLRDSLNRKLTVVELFRYPTISALAGYLGREQAVKPTFDKAAERAQKQREAMRQRIVPRGRR